MIDPPAFGPVFRSAGARGKAEKYSLSNVSLRGCQVEHCSIGLFVAALP